MPELTPTKPLAALVLLACLAALACGGRTSSERTASEKEVETGSARSEAPSAATPETGSETEAGLGEPLDEPERYYGIYANPDQPNRQYFVAEAKRPVWAEQAPEVPPGHLAVGAMFGDVAPIHLRTVSETEFVQGSVPDAQGEPVRVQFELGDDGRAVALTFGGLWSETGRLDRVGDLPEKWQ